MNTQKSRCSMKAKTISREKIDQIHKMLDEKKSHAEIMDALGVTGRQVSYQAAFRPKKQTLVEIARKAGITVDGINKRKQKGMTLEQALTHEKWARYEQSRV